MKLRYLLLACLVFFVTSMPVQAKKARSSAKHAPSYIDGADQFRFMRLAALFVLEDEGVHQRHLFQAADVIRMLVCDENLANRGVVDHPERRFEVLEAGLLF